MEERMKLHEDQVRTLYLERVPMIRAYRGKPEKLKQVEEYVSLQEEALALSHDMDRAERKKKFCDVEEERGKAAHAEYTSMIERARARREEIIPKIEKLRKEVEIKEEEPKV